MEPAWLPKPPRLVPEEKEEWLPLPLEKLDRP